MLQQRPDSIHSYAGNTKSILTNGAAIDRVLPFFADPKRKWELDWNTLAYPDAVVRFEREGKIIGSVFIGPGNWVTIDFASPDRYNYMSKVTKQERDQLLLALDLAVDAHH